MVASLLERTLRSLCRSLPRSRIERWSCCSSCSFFSRAENFSSTARCVKEGIIQNGVIGLCSQHSRYAGLQLPLPGGLLSKDEPWRACRRYGHPWGQPGAHANPKAEPQGQLKHCLQYVLTSRAASLSLTRCCSFSNMAFMAAGLFSKLCWHCRSSLDS